MSNQSVSALLDHPDAIGILLEVDLTPRCNETIQLNAQEPNFIVKSCMNRIMFNDMEYFGNCTYVQHLKTLSIPINC